MLSDDCGPLLRHAVPGISAGAELSSPAGAALLFSEGVDAAGRDGVDPAAAEALLAHGLDHGARTEPPVLAARLTLLYEACRKGCASYALSPAAKRALFLIPKLVGEGAHGAALACALVHCRLAGLGRGRADAATWATIEAAVRADVASATGAALLVDLLPPPGPGWTAETSKPLLACTLAVARAAMALGAMSTAADVLRLRSAPWMAALSTAVAAPAPAASTPARLDGGLPAWLSSQRLSMYHALAGFGSEGRAAGGDAQTPAAALSASVLSLEWLAWTASAAGEQGRPALMPSDVQQPDARFFNPSWLMSFLLAGGRGAVARYLRDVGLRGEGADAEEEQPVDSDSLVMPEAASSELSKPALEASSRLQAVLRRQLLLLEAAAPPAPASADAVAATPAGKRPSFAALEDSAAVGKVVMATPARPPRGPMLQTPAAGTGTARPPADSGGRLGTPLFHAGYVTWTRRYIDLCRRSGALSAAQSVQKLLSVYAQASSAVSGSAGAASRLLVAECSLSMALDNFLLLRRSGVAGERDLGAPLGDGATEAGAAFADASVQSSSLLRKGAGLLQRELPTVLSLLEGDNGGAESNELLALLTTSLARQADDLAGLASFCCEQPLLSLGALPSAAVPAGPGLAGERSKQVKSADVSAVPAAPVKSKAVTSRRTTADEGATSFVAASDGVVAPALPARAATAATQVDWWLLLEQAAVTLHGSAPGARRSTNGRRLATVFAVAAGVAARCRLVRLHLAAAGAHSGKPISQSCALRAWLGLAAAGLLTASDLAFLAPGSGPMGDVSQHATAKLLRQPDALHHLRRASEHIRECSSAAVSVAGSTGLSILSNASALLLSSVGMLLTHPASDGSPSGPSGLDYPTCVVGEVCDVWEKFIGSIDGAAPARSAPALLTETLDAARLPRHYATLANIVAVLTPIHEPSSSAPVPSLGDCVGRALYWSLREALTALPIAEAASACSADAGTVASELLCREGRRIAESTPVDVLLASLGRSAAACLSSALVFVAEARCAYGVVALQEVGARLASACVRAAGAAANAASLIAVIAAAVARAVASVGTKTLRSASGPSLGLAFSSLIVGMYGGLRETSLPPALAAAVAVDFSRTLGHLVPAGVSGKGGPPAADDSASDDEEEEPAESSVLPEGAADGDDFMLGLDTLRIHDDSELGWCAACAPSQVVSPWMGVEMAALLATAPGTVQRHVIEASAATSLLQVAGSCSCPAAPTYAPHPSALRDPLACNGVAPTAEGRALASLLAVPWDGFAHRVSVLSTFMEVFAAPVAVLSSPSSGRRTTSALTLAFCSACSALADSWRSSSDGHLLIDTHVAARGALAALLGAPMFDAAASRRPKATRACAQWLAVAAGACLQSSLATALLGCSALGMRAADSGVVHAASAARLWARAKRLRSRLHGSLLHGPPSLAESTEDDLVSAAFACGSSLWEGSMELVELMTVVHVSRAHGDLVRASAGLERAEAVVAALGLPLSSADGGLLVVPAAAVIRHLRILVTGTSGNVTGCLQLIEHPRTSSHKAGDAIAAASWAAVCAEQVAAAVLAASPALEQAWVARCTAAAAADVLEQETLPEWARLALAECHLASGATHSARSQLVETARDVGPAVLSVAVSALLQVDVHGGSCSLATLWAPSALSFTPCKTQSRVLLLAAQAHEARECPDPACASRSVGRSGAACLLVHAAASVEADVQALQILRRQVEVGAAGQHFMTPAPASEKVGTSNERLVRYIDSAWLTTSALLPAPGQDVSSAVSLLDDVAAVRFMACCHDWVARVREPSLAAVALATPWPATTLALLPSPSAAGGPILFAASSAAGMLPAMAASATVGAEALRLCAALRAVHADSSSSMNAPAGGGEAAEAEASGDSVTGALAAQPAGRSGSRAKAPAVVDVLPAAPKAGRTKKAALPLVAVHQDAAVIGDAEKEAWWSGRFALDAQLEALLAGADTGVVQPLLRLLTVGAAAPAPPLAAEAARGTATPSSSLTAPPDAAALRGMKLTELRGLAAQLGLARPPSKKEDLIAAIVAATPAASTGAEPVVSPSSGAGIAVQHTAACCELASALGRGGRRVFVLGDGLRAFPWEHAPSLMPEGWMRLPAAGPLLVAVAAALQCRAGASAARPDGALAHLRVLGSRLVPALAPAPRSVAYALNPSGDLPRTEAALLPAIKALAKAWGHAPPVGWAGAAAQPPPDALSAAVRSASVYVYAGHGAGELLLPRETVGVCLSPCPPVLLMGCSSGRLESGRGALPEAGASACGRPGGAPLAYLASLCPQLAVCLWDVTDRDIDRYTVALLGEMGAGRGRAGGASEGRAVARAACKLRSLVGAAVVWYGLG